MVGGFIAGVDGDETTALTHLATSATLAAEVGERWVEGSAAWLAAKLLIRRDDGPRAIEVLRPPLRHFTGYGERTGPLAAMHTMAAAFTISGDPATGGLLLAAVDAIGARIGYHPERMDPVDSPAHQAIVTGALDPDEQEAAQATGAALTFEQVLTLVCEEGALADAGH